MALVVEPPPAGPRAAGGCTTPKPLGLAEGTELLGRYEGSAYAQPHYMVRRHDGQVIYVSRLLTWSCRCSTARSSRVWRCK